MKIMMMENIKVAILYEVNYLLNSKIFILSFLCLACVSHVDIHKEEIQLTIDQSTNRMFK